MISLFFSNAARKAWVSGLIGALLTPIHDLLSSDGEITLRTLLVAVLSGILSAAVVFAVSNDDAPVSDDERVIYVNDEPGQHSGGI